LKQFNYRKKKKLFDYIRIITKGDGERQNYCIVGGLSFKPNTDDMREAIVSRFKERTLEQGRHRAASIQRLLEETSAHLWARVPILN